MEEKVTGKYATEKVKFPAGTIVVRTAQPLGHLVFYLLEPESEDGLVTWNFFDSSLKVGEKFPVQKVMTDAKLTTRERKN